MSKGRLQHTVSHYRQQLAQHEAQAEQQLDLAYKHVLATIQPEINRLLKEIGAMQAAGQDIPVSWLYQKNRLGNIKRFIEEHINHFGNISQAEVEQLQRLGVDLGSKNAQQMLDATLPEGVNYLFNRPNAGAIESIIGATQAGSPLADLFNGFGQEAAQGAGRALVRGITLGYAPRKVAKDLQQVLDVPRWRALTIARTEMMRAYNSSALANYQANSNVVQGWQWLASLGSACFPKGTMITTDRGEVPIEHVQAGDLVLTHEGRYRRVTHTMQRNYAGEMVTVQQGNRTVTATSNHPFLVERQGKLDWIEAGNLRLGDHVVCQSDSSFNIANHGIADRPIERCISDTHNSIPFALQEQSLAGVSLGNSRAAMPVNTINFQGDIQGWENKINRQRPSVDSVLLAVNDFQRFQAQAGVLLRFGFASETPIATGGAKTTSISLGGDNPKSLTTSQANFDYRWASAFLRTMLFIVSSHAEYFTASLTGTKWPEIAFAWRSTHSTKASSLCQGINFHGLSTFSAIDGDNFGSMTALDRAEILLRSSMIDFKDIATLLARPFYRWVSNHTLACMRMLLLMLSIAFRGTETPSSFRPSGRDIKCNAALFTNSFHIQSIPQPATHIQKTGLVYNFEVEEDHSYVANGFVVHNCIACTEMNGSFHTLDEDMASHVRCRCTMVPVTGSYSEILGVDVGDSGGMDIPDGASWLADQSESTQRSILGDTRYQYYQDGMPISDMVGTKHDPAWGSSVYIKPIKDLQKVR